MSCKRFTLCFTLPLCLLAGPASVAVGQEDQSGALSGSKTLTESAGNFPPGVDDALVPIDQRTQPGRGGPDLRDTSNQPQPAETPHALWELLAELDSQQRADAEIELELGSDAASAQHEAAAQISVLWNSGLFEPAIEQLRTLEQAGAPVSLGIAWRNPQPPGRPAPGRRAHRRHAHRRPDRQPRL